MNENKPPRIAIVGGGFAGVVTGLELLRGPFKEDYEITIFERAPAPYTTLCGEGLSEATLSRFTPFDSLAYAAERFEGASWWFPGGLVVDVDDPCYTMAREKWIPAMAEEFERSGGRYVRSHKVRPQEVEELSRRFDLVVGADGPGSVVRGFVGGSHRTMLGIQYRIERGSFSGSRLEFYTDKRFSPEYSWVFPKGEILNVGILASESLTAEENWRRLDRFVQERGIEGKILRKEAYPIGFSGTRFQRGNVVLIGDAAGLTNPLTKGGMAAAIYSARILAQSLRESLPPRYEEALRHHPITHPSYERALRILREWSNEEFERLTRFAPRRIRVAGKGTKRKYAWPFLKTLLRHPSKVQKILTLAKAFGLSRIYSW